MPSGPERMECFSSSSTAQPQPVGTRASASSASFVAFARRIAVQTSLDRDRPRSCDAPLSRPVVQNCNIDCNVHPPKPLSLWAREQAVDGGPAGPLPLPHSQPALREMTRRLRLPVLLFAPSVVDSRHAPHRPRRPKAAPNCPAFQRRHEGKKSSHCVVRGLQLPKSVPRGCCSVSMP
jgi:hypothetical protein